MNNDLQIGCDRLARIIDPAYRADKPHPLTKVLASDPGLLEVIDLVQRAQKGNVAVRRAHRAIHAWVSGGAPVIGQSYDALVLEEMAALQKEIEHYKTRDAEHRYWDLQTQESCSPIQAAARLSKEELARLPKNLTELIRRKP